MLEPLQIAQMPIAQQAAAEGFLDRLSPGDLLPLAVVCVVFLAGTVIALSKIIFGAWKRVRERQLAASLIQDMLDRNMSPPEIQQIMNSWASVSGGSVDAPLQPQQSDSPQLPPKPAAT